MHLPPWFLRKVAGASTGRPARISEALLKYKFKINFLTLDMQGEDCVVPMCLPLPTPDTKEKTDLNRKPVLQWKDLKKPQNHLRTDI